MIKHLLAAVIIINSLLPAQITSLKDTSNQFDYVIITIPLFSSYCQDFKLHKELARGFKVIIVDTAQIYTEFKSYESHEENIREFISYAGTYWQEPQPEYFLLAGDISAVPNFEFISFPNYPKTDTTRTDYFYSESIYDSDDDIIDFAVGRIALGNREEINNYFGKVIQYESNNVTQDWNNTFSFIADNGICDSQNDGDIFERRALQIGEELPDYISSKYFFESEESPYYSHPDSVISFLNTEGSSGIIFIGHGNSEIFTCDTMFSISSFEYLRNDSKYFVASFLHAQRFTYGKSTSMLDRMLLAEVGAIAGFNPVGLSYYDLNLNTISNFYQDVYSLRETAIGKIVRKILSKSYNEYKKYNLFGDPSLIIKYDIPASVNSFHGEIPSDYKLYQNYPNPFNPTTTINYHTPKSEYLKLQVFDMLGREITTLAEGYIEAGYHKINFDASGLNSGVYLYKLESSSFSMVRKMLLIK